MPGMDNSQTTTAVPTEQIAVIDSPYIQTDGLLFQGPKASVIISETGQNLSVTHFLPVIESFLKQKPELSQQIKFYYETLQQDADQQIRIRIDQDGKYLSNGLNVRADVSFWLLVKIFNSETRRFRYAIGNAFYVGNGKLITARHCLSTGQNERVVSAVVGKDPSLMENVKAVDHVDAFKDVIPVTPIVDNIPEFGSFRWKPYETRMDDIRDVVLLRVNASSPLWAELDQMKFMLPSMEQNYLHSAVAIIGYPGRRITSPIEKRFAEAFVDHLQGLQELTKQDLLKFIYRTLIKEDVNQITTIGSLVSYDNTYILTTAPAFEVLSGSFIVLLDDPRVLLGVLIGGRPNGLSIGLSYKHPVLRELFSMID